MAKRKPKQRPEPPPSRTLDELVAESKRLREQAASIQEKMIRLADELEANRAAAVKKAESY